MNLKDFGVQGIENEVPLSRVVSKKIAEFKEIIKYANNMDIEDQITLQNEIKKMLHDISPFKNEPVDCVIWVQNKEIFANDYNPNSVAPPEMELLHTSIGEDGYTQPIVAWENTDMYEVVDGFHRNRVGREYEDINSRIHGYLPITIINSDRLDKGDRMASTIRHNRARGKHRVDAMADIVIELKRRNWSDKKIGKQLGMDPDEVLRLTQITGLAEMFENHEFSQAWEVDNSEVFDSFGEEENTEYELDEVEDNVQNVESIETIEPSIPDIDEWEDKTENKSVLMSGDRLFAQVKKHSKNGIWTWYTYLAPMETGKADTKEEAICKAMEVLSS